MATPNQNPEQQARDRIDQQLAAAGWVVQGKKAIDFNAGPGIAVREYQTDVGPADYVLFVNQRAVGVIDAKSDEWCQNILRRYPERFDNLKPYVIGEQYEQSRVS